MAGFWKRVKDFFADDTGTAKPAPNSLEGRLHAAMVRRAAAKTSFEAGQVAVDAAVSPEDMPAAFALVDQIFQTGALDSYGFRRMERDGRYLYNPYSGDSSATALRNAPPAPAPAPVRTTAASTPAPYQTPPPPRTINENSYAANPEILGLSADDLRKRALKIVPWRTAWIGRVDTIPPQSDERTALIDRGLMLGGYLNEKQLAEIHTVGDLWLRHQDATRLAEAAASEAADDAIEALKAEKARLKAEKKKAAAERRAARAAEVARRRAEDIIFLGRGVSKGLHDRRSNIERLTEKGLPVMSTPADVAAQLGLTVPKLRWLCFHSDAAQTVHYTAFEILKRSGGTRLIAAPRPTLAKAQTWVLRNLLEKLPVEENAHGFVKGRSTVTNARAHVGRDVVVNIDLKDFFPSIGFRRVRGVFKRLGYSPAVATVLALLCTEAPRRKVEYDGHTYFVAVGERALPQGACTSPALSNQVARRLDKRLRSRSQKAGWTYTRYADDLSFSAPAQRPAAAQLQAMVRHVAQEEGLAVNPQKGRVLVRGGRQQVTGIVVNQKTSVPRAQVKRLRAILHQAKKTGLAAQNREQHPDFTAWLKGMIAYVTMVDSAKGHKLKAAFDALSPS